jgi:D-tyrosyl-tRNA(Tyr) deacylase
VAIDDDTVAAFDEPGLVILVGVTHADTTDVGQRLAEKIWRLRIMDDELSAADVDAPLLVVSQFTLYAELNKGRRPSWSAAAPGEVSEPLVASFVESLRSLGATVQTGRFGADMKVSLTNDGPRTIWVEL